jgi:glucose/arabinose dehydrogenase
MYTNREQLNHGLAISADGRTIYASTVNSVYAWSYDPSTGTVSGANRTIITGMQSEGHITRTLMMSQSEPGMLVVSRGSDENLDDGASIADTGRSQIRAFNVSSLTATSTPYDYTTQGVRLGWGLRNSVGVAEDPSTGGIYSVENSVDEVTRDGIDIHTDNPGEELNFHGYLNDTSARGNYGYPNCFALWSTDVPDLGALTVGSQFASMQNGTINDTYCTKEVVAPRLTFQAHTAPLDIIFQPNGSEAYVSFHGSWYFRLLTTSSPTFISPPHQANPISQEPRLSSRLHHLLHPLLQRLSLRPLNLYQHIPRYRLQPR